MCDSSAPLEESVPCWCEGIKNLFKSFQKQPPHHLEFLNRLPDIQELAKSQPEESGRRLNSLLRELKAADDGMGGTILSGERFQEFLACRDED